MGRLTDKELLDALNEHEKDCCRCRERICTYESDRYNCLQDKDKKAYKELAEYRRLEEQVLKSVGTDLASMVGEFMHYYNLKKGNRLLELPCKVGDKVWIIDGQCLSDDECWELNGCENCNLYEAYVTEVTFNVDFYDWMGKTVFLTKEEAEKALAEMGV